MNRKLHLFTDAGNEGYGAVAFLRVNHNNLVEVHFLLEKSRVAPFKNYFYSTAETSGSNTISEVYYEYKYKLNLNLQYTGRIVQLLINLRPG